MGEAIQEVMESYEVEIDGKTYQGKFFSLYRDSCLDVCICIQICTNIDFDVGY